MRTESQYAAPAGWHQSPVYPMPTIGVTCVAYIGYIYCLGGMSQSGTRQVDCNNSTSCVYYSSSSFFAQIFSNGSIGAWSSASPWFPYSYGSPRCLAVDGFVYCVGAQGYAGYAPLSSEGIGNWITAPRDPGMKSIPSCTAYNDTIYCVGGDTSFSNGATTQVSYARVLPGGGLGQWANSTSLPPADSLGNTACAAYNSTLICVGGTIGYYPSEVVLRAPILSSGATGRWDEEYDYPVSISRPSCVAVGGYDYCLGGYDNTGGMTALAAATRFTRLGQMNWAQFAGITTIDCTAFESTIYCVPGAAYHSQYVATPIYFVDTSQLQVSATPTATTQQGGGIPEFPFQILAVTAFSAVLVTAYVFFHRRSNSRRTKAWDEPRPDGPTWAGVFLRSLKSTPRDKATTAAAVTKPNSRYIQF